MTCTGCEHVPHPGKCVSCGCGIVTLIPDESALLSELVAQSAENRRLLELVAARTEYLVQHVLDGNEHARKAAGEMERVRVVLEAHMIEEDARMARLEAHFAGNGAVGR